jgi:hypothetical protein
VFALRKKFDKFTELQIAGGIPFGGQFGRPFDQFDRSVDPI